ncbi:mechanosensitive ion channel domain-containing protein [Nitratifractor sp.]
MLRLVLWVLIITSSLHLYAALPGSVQSLVDANASRYSALLADYEKHPDPDPLQASLQQALLHRLIALSQSRISHTANPLDPLLQSQPKSPDDFRRLFQSILNEYRQRRILEQDADRLEKEIKELERDLADPQGKDLRTLQLQYVYNSKVLKRTRQTLAAMDQTIDTLPQHLLRTIDALKVDPKNIREDLRQEKSRLDELDKSRQELELEKERLQILGANGEKYRQLLQGIQSIQKAQIDLKNRQLQDLFLLFVDALKRHDQQAFKLAKRIEKLMKDAGYDEETVHEIDTFFLRLLRKRLGVAATLKSAANQELRHSVDLIWRQLNAPVFHLGNTPFSILKIALAFLLLTIGFLFGWLYKRAISRIDSHNITPSTKTLLGNLGYYLIITVAFFATLHYLGISLTSLALVAGALSVGIGFGLQNIVSNFVSGIILMFERSIKIGDFIELDNGLRGYVSDIRMRSMTITTNSNIDIVVPNQQLIENRVVNWTMNDKIRRFEIPFGVAYGTLVEDVIRVVMEAVGHSGFQEIYSSDDRQTQVIMTGMGNSGVDFALLVWIKGPRTLRPKRTTSRFLTLIYTALNEAGIEIPFPQRDLHLRSVDVALPIRLVSDEEETEGQAQEVQEWKEASPEDDKMDDSKSDTHESESRQ